MQPFKNLDYQNDTEEISEPKKWFQEMIAKNRNQFQPLENQNYNF